jgi:hypothetical protein
MIKTTLLNGLWTQQPATDAHISDLYARFLQLGEELKSNVALLTGGRETQLAVYPGDGTGYHRHRDGYPDDGVALDEPSNNRRISAICYCTSDWKPADGGKVILFGDFFKCLIGRWIYSEYPHIFALNQEKSLSSLPSKALGGWLMVPPSISCFAHHCALICKCISICEYIFVPNAVVNNRSNHIGLTNWRTFVRN